MRLDSGAESLTCEYCGNIVFPEKNDDGVRVLGQPSNELCPTCGIGLVDASFSSAHLRYCTRCRGMLIDMDIFADLVQTLRNVILSDCERCSLNWLDHGKLMRIAHAPDALREEAEV